MELSKTILFTTKAEERSQQQFEAELCQMEAEAYVEYKRRLDAVLADFLIDRDMSRFQWRHADCEDAYGRVRETWWAERRNMKIVKPAPAGGDARP